LRKTAVAIALVLIAVLGIAVPSASAAVGDPKVVIIVGATHGSTASYRAKADAAYAEARKYTTNISRVYSPYATWAAVKKATEGATVVIYFGHGNGWPSPYTYDPTYATKDGFGLNASWGDGDYNNKYYGEPSVSTLKMAPGAIVMLHHLCYASGNSEPGNAEPTVTVARQRADNYAAGFLKAGAAAVLVDGHSGPERYLRDLFTTHQSLLDMWRNQSNANGNFVSFASVRTPGATVHQDPNTPTSGFYRALTVRTPGTTTDEVVSAGYGDTGLDPTGLVVPGNASVTTDGAGLYAGLDTSAGPAASVPAGTRLRLVDRAASTTAEGTPLVEVEGLDDPGIAGFMLASDVAARDSSAPHVRVVDVGVGRFSPNGDGSGDKASIQARFTESVGWTVRVRDDGALLWQTSGTGATLAVEWDGKSGGSGGAVVADGTYVVEVTGVDAWDNAPASSSRSIVVDTAAPDLDGLTPDGAQWFSPNGDGVRDTVTLTGSNSEAGSLLATVRDGGGATVRTFSVASGTGATAVTWNGKTNAGAAAPDGAYAMSVLPVDLAGNKGDAQERAVTVITGLRSVLSSKTVFFPQDKDSLSPTTKLQFTLARPMTVTWTLRDSSGGVVITRLSDSARAAGTHYWIFDGKRSDGSMLPRGRYTSSVTAADGSLVATQTVSFDADAFTIKLSDSTPGRGQSITVYVTTAETLMKNPTLWVYQPGVTGWAAKTTKTGTYTYKVTLKLKTSGGVGPMSFKAWGQDTKGQAQATTTGFTLH
jgi:flagellar hook assembly protein FlgD